MKKKKLKTKLKEIHAQMNVHDQIKGSILVKDDGRHISSIIPCKKSKTKMVSAYIVDLFRYISNINKKNEVKIRLENGFYLYMKRMPSQKIILTSLTDNASSPELKTLMDRYSREFLSVFN